MTRCKICRRPILVFTRKKGGLCRQCEDTVAADIKEKREVIKRCILELRDPTSHRALKAIDNAIACAGRLLNYEKRGIAVPTPRPSLLLDTLRKRRSGLVALELQGPPELAASDTAGPGTADFESSDTGPSVLPISLEEPGVAAETAENSDWLITGPDVVPFCQGPRREDTDSPDRRRAKRQKVQCYALVQPGGLKVLVENLSATGLLAHSQASRAIGQEVRMSLHTARGLVRTTGHVKRLVRDARSHHSGFGFSLAVQFTQASQALEDYLENRKTRDRLMVA